MFSAISWGKNAHIGIDNRPKQVGNSTLCIPTIIIYCPWIVTDPSHCTWTTSSVCMMILVCAMGIKLCILNDISFGMRWHLFPIRDGYKKRWKYRETYNMTISFNHSFILLHLGLECCGPHRRASPTCSEWTLTVMEPWTPAVLSQHGHGFPISKQPADMFNSAWTQTVGQSLMHYMGHSPVKADGISR